MLHLAQVQVKSSSHLQLHILATQTSETTWTVISNSDAVLEIELAMLPPLDNVETLLQANQLVLVTVSDQTIVTLETAIPWILNLMSTYLNSGLTLERLQQEMDRSEQWRQTLTLQNQELGRQRLEIEARREEIQVLEANLKQERQALDQLAAQFSSSIEISPSEPPPL
jgi:hypothetical protein